MIGLLAFGAIYASASPAKKMSQQGPCDYDALTGLIILCPGRRQFSFVWPGKQISREGRCVYVCFLKCFFLYGCVSC